MDLITNLLVWPLTLIAALLTNILAHDICMSADRVCGKIIHRAAKRLALFDQEDVEIEWLGDLSERKTVWEKYHHAIGCYFAAPGMRRRAQTMKIAMNFHVRGVGTVPFTLTLGPQIVFSAYSVATRETTPAWIRKPVIRSFLLYLLARLLFSVHRLGPGSLHGFFQRLKEFKTWEFEVHLIRSRLDLDLTDVFKTMVRDPKQIQPILKRFSESLAKNSKPVPTSEAAAPTPGQ